MSANAFSKTLKQAEPLRIVHILRAPMGGVLRHVRDLALAHAKLGHSVGIICDASGPAGYNETLLERLEPHLVLGITRTAMSRSVGPSDISSGMKIRSLIKDLRPDVVHGHGAKGGVYARACGSIIRTDHGRPARLYSPHGGSLHFDASSKNGKVYFQIEKILERMTDCLCFVAEFEANTYRQKIGTPKCPSRVIYNGLAEDEFEPVALADNAADFLFIGEMRLLKGPDLMLRALSRLKAEGAQDISAVMIGEGPDRDDIHAMIKERDLQTNVTLRPPMPARTAFSLARTVVMPSRAEAMPYIVLEALAAQRPLIATNVGGIPEIFGKAKDFLIEPDVDRLTARMRFALENPEDFKSRMPDHDSLKAEFSIDTMSNWVLEAYHKAKSRRK
jgi:glycosyltransferase involved in cell wall biosynthesis